MHSSEPMPMGTGSCRIGFSASPGGTQAPGLHCCPSWPCRECSKCTVQVWTWHCPAQPTASLHGWGHSWKCCLITYLMSSVISGNQWQQREQVLVFCPLLCHPQAPLECTHRSPLAPGSPRAHAVWSPAAIRTFLSCTLQIQIKMQMETRSSASPATNTRTIHWNSEELQLANESKLQDHFLPGIYAQVSLPHSLPSSQTET